MMTIIGACVVVVCVVAVLVGLCALAVMDQKKHPNKAFDERQTAVRGKAYEFAMLFTAAYYGIAAFVLSVFPEDVRPISAGDLVLIGLFLMLLAVHSYCLFADAVLPLGQNPIILTVCYLAGGIMCLAPVIQAVWLFGPEMSSSMWMQLSSAAVLFTIGLIHWAAWLRDRK